MPISLSPRNTSPKKHQKSGSHHLFLIRNHLLLFLLTFSLHTMQATNQYKAKEIGKEAFKIWHQGKAAATITEKERHIFRTVAAFGVDHPDLVKEYLFLAILSIMHQNYDQANTFIQKGIKVATNLSFFKAIKDFYELQGIIHYQLEKYEKAQASFKKAFEHIDSLASWEEPQAILSILCYIMRAAYELGHFEEVIFYGEMVASQATTSFLEKTAEVGEAYEMLARAYYKQKKQFKALYYSRASLAIIEDLPSTTSSQLLRSYYLAFQMHQAIHDYAESLHLLYTISRLLNRKSNLDSKSYTSYIEKKYNFPTALKPLNKITPTMEKEEIETTIQKLRLKNKQHKKELLFPPNSIPPHFQLTYPTRTIFLPICLILISYVSWGGWIYSILSCWKASTPQQRRISILTCLGVTLLIIPLSLYLLYIARSMMVASGLKVGFTNDLLILDQSIEEPRQWFIDFLKKSLLWFMNLEAIVVIPYQRIQKIVWYSGGTIHTESFLTTHRTQSAIKSELGEEYAKKITQQAIVDNAEKYTIIEKKKSITKVAQPPQQNQQNNNQATDNTNPLAEKYQATETVQTTITSFAGVNKLAIHTVWKGKPRVYLITNKEPNIYGEKIGSFFKILLQKGIPFSIIIEDGSDLLKKKKKYLKDFCLNKKTTT